MTTSVTQHEQRNTIEGTLFVAFELSEKTWKLGFTTGQGQKPRERTVPARARRNHPGQTLFAQFITLCSS